MDGDPGVTAPGVDVTEPDEGSWVGRVVAGRWRLVEELGAGGIAVVFRAEDVELTRSVAVKILQESGHGRAELRARFEREAKVLAALSHPNIVSLVDFGVEDGRAYLVMELLRGQTVGELLDREDILPPDRAFHIIRQVLRALAYAHGEGLLHRDLKPDNVFLQALPDTPDHVRLLDFGFAKFVDSDRGDGAAPLTQAGTVFGTPRYMAPEQLTGGNVDARADLYAVAVILYEMLCGRRPFEGEVRDVLKAKVVHDPPSLSSVAPDFDVAPELDAFFARALAMRRDDRHADAQAVLDALDAIPQPAVRAKPLAPVKAAPPKRSVPLVLIVVAVLGLGVTALSALVGGVVWLLWPEEAPPAIVVEPPPSLPEPIVEPQDESALGVPDPWESAATRAPAVQAVHDAIVRGEPVDATALRALRDYASASPNDALAQILLGHVYTERNMRAMAIGAYERATQIDPGSRGDPRMIVNLVRMAAESDSASGAGRLVREVYGADALPVIDAALATPGVDAREARRLQSLRDSIAAH